MCVCVWQNAGLYVFSTMFAFLMGACGANLKVESVVALGVAQLVAGAMGMGMGEYLSAQADADVARMEVFQQQSPFKTNDALIHRSCNTISVFQSSD